MAQLPYEAGEDVREVPAILALTHRERRAPVAGQV
jgi:hypothetical protein